MASVISNYFYLAYQKLRLSLHYFYLITGHQFSHRLLQIHIIVTISNIGGFLQYFRSTNLWCICDITKTSSRDPYWGWLHMERSFFCQKQEARRKKLREFQISLYIKKFFEKMFLKGHGWSESIAEDVLKVADHEYDV